MKSYKPTYCFSLPILLAEFFLILVPGMLCIDIISAWKKASAFGDMIGAYLLVGVVFVIFAVVIWFLLSRIGKLFSKVKTTLTDTAITHGQKTFSLHSIRYITVHLPEMESRSSSSPLTLFLWADNEHYADIKRPSLRLIFQLKKQCPYAAFSIEDLKSRIKQNSIISAVFLVILPLIFFLD